jgi:hypothetical protein
MPMKMPKATPPPTLATTAMTMIVVLTPDAAAATATRGDGRAVDDAVRDTATAHTYTIHVRTRALTPATMPCNTPADDVENEGLPMTDTEVPLGTLADSAADATPPAAVI